MKAKILTPIKSFLFLAIILLCVTSCVDYVQSLTYKNGKYQMYYKITLSKVLFAMAEENPEELFKDLDKETLEGLPKNVTVKPVNTDLEVGAEFILNINPKTNDPTEKSFLPTIAGAKCFIPFLLGQNDSISDSLNSGSGEDEKITQAILSSAKCRILISKNIIASVENAYFEGKGGQNYAIPVFDYGESFCLEIPFIVLFEKGMYRTDRIVVLKEK